MQKAVSLLDQIHERALTISMRYLATESDLIDILDQVDRHRVFLAKGHSSLFQYVVCELSLSENVAYNLISVMRKSREVPALKTELKAGNMTLSNARRIIPVLKKENQTEWLTKAANLSQRELEKEVAKVRPEAAVPERASYISETRVRLEMGLSEKDMLQLRRVQDLLAQKRKMPVSLEEVLVAMTEEYLDRHDPLKKAKRQIVKKGTSASAPEKATEEMAKQSPTDLNSSLVSRPVRVTGTGAPASKTVREPIPAALLHQIQLRDQGRCTEVNAIGKRCNQSRWIEIHHKKPVSQGGTNTLENLTTLCSAHHGWAHRPG